MDKKYYSVQEGIGIISISPDVISGIAAQACLNTKGVSSMASAPAGAKGSQVVIDGETCTIAAYIMVGKDCVIAETAKEAQKNVKGAVEAACGITVTKCDIFVAGIELKK